MRFLLINLFFLASSLVMVAQKPATTSKSAVISAKPAPVKGHSIPITLTPLKNCTVYLGSYFGKGMTLVDSAKLNGQSQGRFVGSKKLTGGIYFVVSPNYAILFELLMDDQQQFSIVADTANKENARIIGSPDNDLFKQYAVFTNERGRFKAQLEDSYKSAATYADSNNLRNSILKIDSELDAYRSNVAAKYPNSLLTLLFNVMKRPSQPAMPIVKGKVDSLYPFHYVKSHYWDDVLFNDNRLLRTPFFESKLDDYFKYYVSPEPDSIISDVKYMLLSARSGNEIYPYLLTKFTNKYMNPEFMGQDKVFVYLFENFYAKGDTNLLNPASRKTITERAYSLMANQLGLPAPVLDLTDTTGKKQSLYGIKAPFTVVAFWDPNCGHCKDEIPQLDSLYKAKWKAKGVAIYSVNIYENEVPAWKKFIAEKQLSKEWVHAYQTKEAKQQEEKAGVPNYRQLYDIFKTPTLYLLDSNKHIIAKQLSLEQFDKLMEAKQKN